MRLSPTQRNVLSEFYLHVAEGAALALSLNQFQPSLSLNERITRACLLLVTSFLFLLFAVELRV
jgi:hypothetical protein